MTTNRTTVVTLLRERGIRVCPAYGPEGVYVADRGEGIVLMRVMGPAQTQLAEAATVVVEHAGLAVEPAPPSKWDAPYTNLIVRDAACPSCAEADRIGLRDTLAKNGLSMSCGDCGSSDTVNA